MDPQENIAELNFKKRELFRKKIYSELKTVYDANVTNRSPYEAEIFYDALFELVENNYREHSKKSLELNDDLEFELIYDLTQALKHHDLFEMIIKHAIDEHNKQSIAELSTNNFEEKLHEFFSKE